MPKVGRCGELYTRYVVVPRQCQNEVLHLSHESPLAGHLGINKAYWKVLQHFYWPGLRRDVVKFCTTCHTCQMTGKPNQCSQVAPLIPIPAMEEPFNRIIIDRVGQLPKTKSRNKYLLTIIYSSIRFPEAVALKNIKAPKIVTALIKYLLLVVYRKPEIKTRISCQEYSSKSCIN